MPMVMDLGFHGKENVGFRRMLGKTMESKSPEYWEIAVLQVVWEFFGTLTWASPVLYIIGRVSKL